VLLEHKDGHAQLAQRLIEKEVIFAEDLEEIFGKRPWTSRTDEILAANAEEDQAEDEQSNNATDHKKENEEIIRQKIVQAVIEKAEKAKEAEQNAPDAPADQQSETDKPKEA
jgi:cell division protease FtsH